MFLFLIAMPDMISSTACGYINLFLYLILHMIGSDFIFECYYWPECVWQRLEVFPQVCAWMQFSLFCIFTTFSLPIFVWTPMYAKLLYVQKVLTAVYSRQAACFFLPLAATLVVEGLRLLDGICFWSDLILVADGCGVTPPRSRFDGFACLACRFSSIDTV